MTQVVASLEGMKVSVQDKECALYKYDYDHDTWGMVESAVRPMARSEAQQWLTGWNSVDKRDAIVLLTEPYDGVEGL